MIRVGVIGCGGIADWHIAAIEATPEMKLTAVCDTNYDLAKKVAVKHQVQVFEDAEMLLASECVDVAAICTPSGSHAELSMLALKFDVYPIVEKPMAITCESLDRLLKAERESQAFICPISQLRFLPDVQRVKAMMAKKRLGRLTSADLSMKYWRDSDYYSQKPWRGTWEHDGGGALMNQGIHGLDMLRYLCGTPKCISATAATLCHNIQTEDTLNACLIFPGGALGSLTASTAAYPGAPRRMEIFGDRGSLTLVEGDLVDCSIRKEAVTEHTGGGHSNPFAIDSLPHKLQYRNIADAILNKAELAVTASDAAETLNLIFDIYRKADLRN